MGAMEELKAVRDEIKRLREEANEKSKKAFHDSLGAIFDAHPIMTSFGWNQYTPYFNDGDECKFSANIDEPDINGENSWNWPDDHDKALDAAETAVSRFLECFDDEDFKAMFGDHVEVVVTREGIEATEYSHD